MVASFGPHYGEESVLVGRGGSGTIFLSGCNLKCAFCQNYDISHSVVGRRCSPEDIAAIMIGLERQGCENANFVTPTHHAPQVAEAVLAARREGFSKPVVYNCGGYESVEALSLLEGIVDIYMPDVKFLDEDRSQRYLDARDYPGRVRAALEEMNRQVGDLVVRGGVALRGLLVRHLVMPGLAEDSRRIVDFLADKVSGNAFVNVMGQYRPLFRAREFAEIAARPTPTEIAEVRSYADKKGLRLSD
jgi:putative pyruvate formate lyase activating enzyme